MKFDIEGARKAGYSDNEIASYLAEKRGFDLEGALKAGYSPIEVVSYLTGSATKDARPSLTEILHNQTDETKMLRAGMDAGYKYEDVDRAISAELERQRLASEKRTPTNIAGDLIGQVVNRGKPLGGLVQSIGDAIAPEPDKPIDTFREEGGFKNVRQIIGKGLSQYGSEIYDEGKAVEQQLNVEMPNSTTEGLYSGLKSTARQAPMMLSPFGTLATVGEMSTEVGLEKYGEARQAGYAPGTSALIGAGHGGVEAATEILPTKIFKEAVAGKIGLKEFIMGQLKNEIPGEQLATLAQDAIDQAAGLSGKTKGDWEQYWRERPDAAYQTLLATLAQGGVSTGGVQVANMLRNTTGAQLRQLDQDINNAEWNSQQIDAAAVSALSPDNAQLERRGAPSAFDDATQILDAIGQAGDVGAAIDTALNIAQAPITNPIDNIPPPNFGIVNQDGTTTFPMENQHAPTLDAAGNQGTRDLGIGSTGDPSPVGGLDLGRSADSGAPVASLPADSSLGSGSQSDPSLTDEIVRLEGLRGLTTVDRPTGTLEVSGPNARELVTSLVPGESVQQRKDGSVIVGLKHADTVRQALATAQAAGAMSLPQTNQGVQNGQGQEEGRRQEVLTPTVSPSQPGSPYQTTQVTIPSSGITMNAPVFNGADYAVSRAPARGNGYPGGSPLGSPAGQDLLRTYAPGASVITPEAMRNTPGAGLAGRDGVEATDLTRVISGRKLVLYTGAKDNGLVFPDDKDYVFVNVDPDTRPISIITHEITHAMRRDDPGAYDGFTTATANVVDRSDEALLDFAQIYDQGKFKRSAIQQRLKAGETATEILDDLLPTSGLNGRDGLLEEFNSDLMGRAAEHEETWRMVTEEMARQNPSILRRFLKQIEAMAQRVREAMTGKPGFHEMDAYVLGKTAQEVEANLKVIRRAAAQALARYSGRNQQNRDAMFAQRHGDAQVLRAPRRTHNTQAKEGESEEGASQTLPTRWPTSVGATPSVHAPMLADLDTLRQTPKQFEQAVTAISEEPGMRTRARTFDGKLEAVLDKMVSNLLWLYDQVPPEIRERSKLWYDGAGEIATQWSKRYGKTRSQTAGILAVLSPQKDWFMNVTMGERVLDILSSQMDHKFDSKMKGAAFQFLLKDLQKPDAKRVNTAAFNAVKDKTLREVIATGDTLAIGVWLRAYDEAHHAAQHAVIHPEGDFGENATTVSGSETLRAWGGFDALGKAASIFVDGSLENINQKLGGEHKVRNFYNNIFAPHDERFTTIDTHAVAADMLRPLAGADKPVSDNFGASGGSNLTGVSGTYPIHYEAYKRAAEARGVLPREMQSITWEAIRGLFTEGFKGKKDNLTTIDNLWRQVDQGKLTVDQARQQILELAGGIEHPDWWNGQEPNVKPSQRAKSYEQSRPAFQGVKVSFEVAPNPNDKALTKRWNALSEDTKRSISYDIAWDIAAKTLAFYNSDTIKGELHTQVGGYLEDTNPSFSIWMNKYASMVKIKEITNTLGYALKQNAMIIGSPKAFKGATEKGVVIIKDVSDTYAKTVYDELRSAILSKDGKPLIDGHTTAEGDMAILVPLDQRVAIAQQVAEYLGDRHDVTDTTYFVEWPERGENDYGLSGQQTNRGSTGAQSPLQAHADQLRQQAEQELERRIQAAEGGSVLRSPGRSGTRDEGSAGSVRAPGYGTGQPGSVSLTGVHYSKAERNALAGYYYGQGMKGAEKNRLNRDSATPDQRRRIHYYVDEGSGIRPESDVGDHAHATGLGNLYDWTVDPLNLWDEARDAYADPADRANKMEQLIMERGFDGVYAAKAQGNQGVAVLLGPKHVHVPVQYLGTGYRGGDTVAPTQAARTEQTDADRVEAARTLPMGEMTGAEWKKMIPLVVQGADVSMLDDGQRYYKAQVVEAMRGQVLRSPNRAPAFYSQLSRAVEQAPDRVFGPATQVKAWLASNAGKLGIKQDEIQWTGINDYLDLQGKTKVTKQQVLDYLAQGGVKIEEVMKGKPGYDENNPSLPESGGLDVIPWENLPDDAARELEDKAVYGRYVVLDNMDTPLGIGQTEADAINDAYSGYPQLWDTESSTKYGDYTLPGGENYRELLMTLPERASPLQRLDGESLFDYAVRQGWPEEKAESIRLLAHQGDDSAAQIVNQFYGTVDTSGGMNYSSGHWDEANILAHIRFNDRTDADGAKVLFIEEVQSDLAQDKRKGKTDFKGPFIDKTEAWVDLALKRVMMYAVEHGYQKVAFVTGQQSADRYDLSKQVDSISWDGDRLQAWDPMRREVLNKTGVQEADLEDYIGKEVAGRLVAQPKVMGKHLLSGEDLKVGGEGMKTFYDAIVPQRVKEVLKKLGGGKLENVTLGSNDKLRTVRDDDGTYALEEKRTDEWGESYWEPIAFGLTAEQASKHAADDKRSQQPGFAVTDAMREKVSAGVPLFSPQRNFMGTPIQNAWAEPEMTHFDNIVRQLQDKLVDTKRVVYAIREAGVDVDTRFDPYSQEILYHGRTAKAVNDFADSELKPLLNGLRLAGIEMRELEDYLWAVHAPERNKQMAKINPSQKELDAQIQQAGQDLLDAEYAASQDPTDWAKHQAMVSAEAKLQALRQAKPFGRSEEERLSLSGLSNKEAREILAGNPIDKDGRRIQLNPSKMAAYQRLATMVRAINEKTLQSLVDYGLEKQETIDVWKRTYPNYVPLNRDLEADDNYLGAFGLGLGTGQGFSVKGSASKRATGSNRDVTDIIANLAMQRERAITRGEKNRVALATYALALKAPNTDFWLPINPAASQEAQAKTVAELVAMGLDPVDAQNLAQEPKDAFIDPRTGLVVRRINTGMRHRDNVLAVRVNGEDRYLYFSSDERAQAMVRNLKNLDAEHLNAFLQGSASITRWFASVNTQYNPVFGLVNGFRDMQSAMLNLSSTPLAGHQKDVLKYGLMALRGIYSDLRAHRDGRTATSAWAQEFEEFGNEGGQTGYRDMFQTSKARTDALQSALNDLSRGNVKKWMVINETNPIFAWLSDYNTTIENAFRLAAYKVAKEQGMTKQEAAILAKNLTVNFNKKGLVATQTGALYAFFNAAVQGTARIGETLLEHRGNPSDFRNLRLSSTGQKIIVGGIMLGVLQALMGAAAGWDDDEPKQFQREKNFIIPVPGTDKYVSIPLPLGFHILPNIGRTLGEYALSGFKEPGKRMTQMLGLFSDAFNPLGSASSFVQTMLPTVFDPFLALEANRDWTGNRIYKEDFNKNQPTPGWTRTKDSATPWARAMAYGINWISGGFGPYERGLASPTPDQIDYLIGQVTGGVGRELGKVADTIKGAAQGEDVPLYKVPVAGRFAGETKGVSSEVSRFYENLKRVGEHADPIERMKEAGRGDLVAAYYKEHPEAAYVTASERAMNRMQKLERTKQQMLKNGASRAEVKQIEEAKKETAKVFNRMVRKALGYAEEQ